MNLSENNAKTGKSFIKTKLGGSVTGYLLIILVTVFCYSSAVAQPTLVIENGRVITGNGTVLEQASDTLQYGPEYYEVDHDLSKELNLVYIGGNWCAPCHKDTLKQALEEAKLALYEKAKEQEMNYSVIGVANDQSVEKGWKFLNSSGYFDEVIIGKKWTNSGAIDFIFDQEGVRPAIPQIIVFKRLLEFNDGIEVGKKKIIVRKIGANAIYEWVENGTPFGND